MKVVKTIAPMELTYIPERELSNRQIYISYMIPYLFINNLKVHQKDMLNMLPIMRHERVKGNHLSWHSSALELLATICRTAGLISNQQLKREIFIKW